MARKKLPPVPRADARTIGALLRGLRHGAGFRAVADAVAAPGCPAARQTIYAYERGRLVPSLQQFLELVEFYVLKSKHGPDARSEEDLRVLGVAAVTRALSLPAYHVRRAHDLIERLQPPLAPERSR